MIFFLKISQQPHILIYVVKYTGIFKQKGSSHYCGAGCPECGALKRANNRALTTNDIIEKSMLKFGNKFNYFKTKYNRKR